MYARSPADLDDRRLSPSDAEIHQLHRPRLSLRRAGWYCVGVLSLGLAGLGAVLPLLPTTCFLLLAAYAFARSSERLHARLLAHPLIGPTIRDWRSNGAIRTPAKCWAVLSMVVAFAISIALHVPFKILAIQALCLTTAAAFIVTRPAA